MRGILVLSFVSLLLADPCLLALPSMIREDEETLSRRLTVDELIEWRHLRYAMSDLERRAYLAQRTPEERRSWVERFWVGRDPSPSTPKNERRLEHDERVKRARAMFPATGVEGWDARGETLIRFGMPDSRHSIQGEVSFSGAVPPREIWYYQRLNMIVNFEDPVHQNRYVLAMGTAANAPGPGLSGPDDIGQTADADLAAWEARTRNLIGEIEHGKYIEAINNYFTWRDTRQSVYSCDLKNPLTVYFDVATFRTVADSLATEVCVEIPIDEIKLVNTNGTLSGDVRIDVLARDQSMNTVATASDSIHIALPNTKTRWPRLAPGRVVLPLNAGFYSLSVEALDGRSRRAAALCTDISVAELGGSPDISDIRFASSIRAGGPSNAFTREGLEIVPHPIHAYRIPFPVTLYFEIYGLSTDQDDRALYSVEYTISPRDAGHGGRSRGTVVASSEFESSGTGPRQTQPLQIQTENLWEGAFELSVKVTDRRTGRSAAKTGRFSVLGR